MGLGLHKIVVLGQLTGWNRLKQSGCRDKPSRRLIFLCYSFSDILMCTWFMAQVTAQTGKTSSSRSTSDDFPGDTSSEVFVIIHRNARPLDHLLDQFPGFHPYLQLGPNNKPKSWFALWSGTWILHTATLLTVSSEKSRTEYLTKKSNVPVLCKRECHRLFRFFLFLYEPHGKNTKCQTVFFSFPGRSQLTEQKSLN